MSSLRSLLPTPVRRRLGRVKRTLLGTAPVGRSGGATRATTGQPKPGSAAPKSRLEVRRDFIFRTADRAGTVLELGPAHNPILPKRDGFATKTADYLDRDGLVAKYRDFKQYSPDDIEDVDYVIIPGAPISDVIHERFEPGARVARAGAQRLADRLPQRLHEPPRAGRRPVPRHPRPSLLLRPVSGTVVHRTRHRHVPPPTGRPHRRHHDGVLAECGQASRDDVMVGRPHGPLSARPRPRRGQGERGTSARARPTSTSTIGSSRPTTSG